MRTGIVNGLYTGIDEGIEQGAYTGINKGLEQGLYYETLKKNVVIVDGLQLYYDATNQLSYSRTSTSIVDLSQNRNNGTLLNGVGFSPLNKGFLTFDGINDSINAGDTASIRFGTSSLTISAWVYLPNSSVVGTIAMKRLQGGNFNLIGIQQGTPFISGSGYDGSASKKIVIAFYTEGTNRYVASTVNDIADGTWKHITLVRDSATTTATLYVNLIAQSLNVLFNSGTGINTDISVSGRNWYIGGLGDVGSSFLKCNISSFLMYNRALSLSEITQNYYATKGTLLA